MNTALLFAAGRGERLRPLTDKLPKALCPVKGVPLIEYHVKALVKAGIQRLVINHAYLGGQIRHYLGHGENYGLEILYSPEPCGALETGGGIAQAMPLLGKEPFIAVNADIYTEFDFSTLSLPCNSLGHLVLVPNNLELKHFGDFNLDENALLSNTPRCYTYAGIAVYHPDLFKNFPVGRYSLLPRVRQKVEEKKISGVVFKGSWYDIGSLERLNSLELALLS